MSLRRGRARRQVALGPDHPLTVNNSEVVCTPMPTQSATMLTAQAPTQLVDTLTEAAAVRGVSRSEAVRQAIAAWITDPPSEQMTSPA